MKVYLLVLLALLASCSDDKVTSPEEKESFPILYETEADELFESIIRMRDTVAFGNYTRITDPKIFVEGTVFDFYSYTSVEHENYFKQKPPLKKVFETDTTTTLLYKRSFYIENTHNISDSIVRKRVTHFYTGIFEGTLFHRSELAINLVGRKNTITTEAEYIGKERVDVYFLEKRYLNEPLKR